MDQYEATVTDQQRVADSDPVMEKYEDSEMYMFKAMVYEESGKLREALELLEKRADKIVDKMGALEQKARLHARLAAAEGGGGSSGPDGEAAVAAYRQLLSKNPDNHRWHEALQKVMGIAVGVHAAPDATQLASLKQLYGELQQEHPRSDTCKRFPLDYLAGGGSDCPSSV